MKNLYKGKIERTKESGEKYIENTEVPLDQWAWAALYDDRTVLRQFEDEDMSYHYLREIEQDRVVLFTVFRTDDENVRYDVMLPEGAQIIYVYRNISIGRPDAFQRAIVFGYKLKLKGGGYEYQYNYIMPNGQVVMSNADNVQLTDFIDAI